MELTLPRDSGRLVCVMVVETDAGLNDAGILCVSTSCSGSLAVILFGIGVADADIEALRPTRPDDWPPVKIGSIC